MSKLLHKRFLSVFVMLSTLCMLLFPANFAFADNYSTETTPQGVTLATVFANTLDDQFINFLKENNIEIKSNDTVSLVRYSDISQEYITNSSTSDITELHITSQSGDNYTTSILQAYSCNSNGTIQLTNVPVEISKTRDSTSLEFKDWQNSYDVIMNFSTYYTLVNNSSLQGVYIRPQGFNFSYHYTSSTVDLPLNAINIEFQTQGDLYQLNTSTNQYEFRTSEYVYGILDSFVLPNEYYTYSCIKTMSSNQCIRVTADQNSGLFMVFAVRFGNNPYITQNRKMNPI